MTHFRVPQFTTKNDQTMFDKFSKSLFKPLMESLGIKILSDREVRRTGKDFICDGATVPSYLADTLIEDRLLAESTSRKSYDRFVSKDMPDSYPVLPEAHKRERIYCNIPKRRYEIWNEDTQEWVAVDPYSIYCEFPYPEGLNSSNMDEAIAAWKTQGMCATIWKFKHIVMIRERDGEGHTSMGDLCVKMPLEYRFRLRNGVIIPEKFPLIA